MHRRFPQVRRAALLSAAVMLLAPAAGASAARTEQPLATPPGPFADVTRSLVTLDAPMPAGVPAHPAACDQLRYYRYRRTGGPADPQQADAVFVNMPGVLGGAGSLEMHGLNVVQLAAERGRSVEVWALDRRSNCLEDRHGLDAALRANDPAAALDYYFGRKEIEGRTFGGFLKNGQVAIAAHFDLKQTIEDYRTVIVEGMPDADARARKLFCGGHSLGGSLTGQLMAWDFDGDDATTGDAGYELCRASIALDSVVTADPSGLGDVPLVSESVQRTRSYAYNAVTSFVNSSLRVVDFGFIGPETMGTLLGVGVTAQLRPDTDTSELVARIPTRGAAEQGLRLFHSRTTADLVAPVAMLRRQQLTGEALLGAFLDDDTQPLSFIRTSLGVYDRGPVGRKAWSQGGSLLFPTATDQLYGWASFDDALPVFPQPNGLPYSTPESEVTDIQDMARVLGNGPLDFAEEYFPTRITTDVGFSQAGFRSGDLAHVRYAGGPAARPRLTVFAADGVTDRKAPPVRSGDVVRTLPGYDHLDVVTASPRQNNGQPEGTAAAVVDFLLTHAGSVATADPADRDGEVSAQTVARRLRAAR